MAPDQKEFVNRLALAHESALEYPADRLYGHDVPVGTHFHPSVILGESNMVASAPPHLREAAIKAFGPFRTEDEAFIRHFHPDFTYGAKVIPKAIRKNVADRAYSAMTDAVDTHMPATGEWPTAE
jgi:hypothetical protein